MICMLRSSRQSSRLCITCFFHEDHSFLRSSSRQLLRWFAAQGLLRRHCRARRFPPDYRYKVETLLEDIPQPMQVKLAPDGRIFFNEYRGKLKIYHPDTKQVVEAGTLEVWAQQENGFLGFALDPKFSENGWIYCLYSPPDYPGQHLSRFTMKGDTLDLSSEKLILQFEEQRKECCHHAGSVEFGPDGCLYPPWATAPVPSATRSPLCASRSAARSRAVGCAEVGVQYEGKLLWQVLSDPRRAEALTRNPSPAISSPRPHFDRGPDLS